MVKTFTFVEICIIVVKIICTKYMIYIDIQHYKLHKLSYFSLVSFKIFSNYNFSIWFGLYFKPNQTKSDHKHL